MGTTLTGINLGQIQSIRIAQITGLTQLPVIGKTMADSAIYDLAGPGRQITITGQWIDTTLEDIYNNYVAAVNTKMNIDFKTTSLTFTSDVLGDNAIQVLISSCNFDWDFTTVRCNYSLKLFEGKTIEELE